VEKPRKPQERDDHRGERRWQHDGAVIEPGDIDRLALCRELERSAFGDRRHVALGAPSRTSNMSCRVNLRASRKA